MFNYKSYKNEYDELEKDMRSKFRFNFLDEEYKKFSKEYENKRIELNKTHRIIFIHDLEDAWRQPINQIIIVDQEKDNIIEAYPSGDVAIAHTIPYDDINRIKNIFLKSKRVFENVNMMFPSVLDGTSHKLFISDLSRGKEMNESNIWYWLDEKNIESPYIKATKEEREYTKEIILIINSIQNIIDKNKIDLQILSDLD